MIRRAVALLSLAALVVAPSLAFGQASPFPLTGVQTLQSAAAALGNGLNFDTSRFATVTVSAIATSGTTTVTLEASLDGSNWTTMLACTPIGTASNAGTISVTSTQKISRCNTTGVPLLRVRISTCTSCVGVTVVAAGSSVPLGFND